VGQVGWTGILTLVKVTIQACDDRRRASLEGAAELKYAELIPQKRAIVQCLEWAMAWSIFNWVSNASFQTFNERAVQSKVYLLPGLYSSALLKTSYGCT
jgi:hypothetical protein